MTNYYNDYGRESHISGEEVWNSGESKRNSVTIYSLTGNSFP